MRRKIGCIHNTFCFLVNSFSLFPDFDADKYTNNGKWNLLKYNPNSLKTNYTGDFTMIYNLDKFTLEGLEGYMSTNDKYNKVKDFLLLYKDDYIVNSNHILTCYLSGHKSIYWKNSTKTWNMIYYDKKNI